jgi:hypothetical protein
MELQRGQGRGYPLTAPCTLMTQSCWTDCFFLIPWPASLEMRKSWCRGTVRIWRVTFPIPNPPKCWLPRPISRMQHTHNDIRYGNHYQIAWRSGRHRICFKLLRTSSGAGRDHLNQTQGIFMSGRGIHT